MNDQPESTATVRVCRKCSAQTDAAGDFCPHCGTAFVVSKRRPSKRIIVVAAAVAVLAVGAGGTALALQQHSEAEAAALAERQQQRDEDAAARQAENEQVAEDAERDMRSTMVEELEKNITKSAKEAAGDGVLEGPIKKSSCTATGGSVDDLTALTGTFECLAINEENDDGTASGYAYTGTIDWDSGELQWQLGG